MRLGGSPFTPRLRSWERARRGHRDRRRESQAHASGGRGWGEGPRRVCSQGAVRVSKSRSHLGTHCPATPQSWTGRLPAAHSSSPATSRPQSGEGEDAGASGFAPGVCGLLAPSAQPAGPLLPCSFSLCHSPFPRPPPSALPRERHPSVSRNPPLTPPNHFVCHLLYHFHNLPGFQRQFVRLLRAVTEVHFAPSLEARRFGGVIWIIRREKRIELAPVR